MKSFINIVVIILIRFSAEANNFTAEQTDREHLIFNHFTATAVAVVSIITIVLTVFTIMACYIDFGNIKNEMGNLEVFDDYEEEFQSTRPEVRDRVTASESERRKLVKEDVDSRGSVSAVKPTDLAADAVQISKLSVAPPRLDAQAKQARIIEAIYQASGREVPLIYRTEKKTQDKIVIPAEVHQTLEGIADRDIRSEGSPVVSPSRLRYPTASLPNREESQTDVSATMITTGLSNLPTTDQPRQPDGMSATSIPKATSPYPPTDVATTPKRQSETPQLTSTIHPDDVNRVDSHSNPTSLVISQIESVKAGTTSTVKRSTKASPKEPLATSEVTSKKTVRDRPSSKSDVQPAGPKK